MGFFQGILNKIKNPAVGSVPRPVSQYNPTPSAPPPAYSPVDTPAQYSNSYSSDKPQYPIPQDNQFNDSQGSESSSSNSPSKEFAVRQLTDLVRIKKGINKYITPTMIDKAAERVASGEYERLAREYEFTHEQISRAAILEYMEVFVVADNSGSMTASRVKELQTSIRRVADFLTTMDKTGIDIVKLHDHINSKDNYQSFGMTNLSSPDAVNQYFSHFPTGGGTPLGKTLELKIIEPCMKNFQQSGSYKPIVVYIFTDGEPNDTSYYTLENVLTRLKQSLNRLHQSPCLFSISIIQVGDDPDATEYLDGLDDHKVFGDCVDTVSRRDIEKAQCLKRTGTDLKSNDYVFKMLMGAVDPRQDEMDSGTTSFGWR